tara:strand:+ start:2971 stop:3342 length:372 start_codon:yes stop_codon:yes gene_type:complete
MKNKKRNKKSDKDKLEAITKLLSPRRRKYYKIDDQELSSQEVTFMVENNGELRYIISCLLRVSILALEGDGILCPPRLPFCSNESAVITILELIDNILPDDQLSSYDDIEKLLLSKAPLSEKE